MNYTREGYDRRNFTSLYRNEMQFSNIVSDSVLDSDTAESVCVCFRFCRRI